MPTVTKFVRVMTHCWHEVPTHKIVWPFNHVILGGHVTKYMHFISTCRRPKSSKLRKVVTYRERLPNESSCDKLKKLYLHFHIELWMVYLAGWLLHGGDSECKCLITHWLLVTAVGLKCPLLMVFWSGLLVKRLSTQLELEETRNLPVRLHFKLEEQKCKTCILN